MSRPFIPYLRDKPDDPLRQEWVVNLPGPGEAKLVSDSKTLLEADLDRLDNLIKGASDAKGTQEEDRQ